MTIDCCHVRSNVVMLSPDGRSMAYHIAGMHLGGLGVAMADVASGRVVSTNAPSRWRVCDLLYTPDGRSLIMAGFDSRIHVWRLETNALAGHEKETCSLAFSRDGRSLASASDDATIKLWDIASGHERSNPQGTRLARDNREVLARWKDPRLCRLRPHCPTLGCRHRKAARHFVRS